MQTSSNKGTIKRVPIPAPILNEHRNIDLHVDFFFVNRLAFLHTKSEKVNFITVQYCKSRSVTEIKKGLTIVMDVYKARGFNIASVHADGEFNNEKIMGHVRPAILNIKATEEHDGVIERSIQTVKNAARCMCNATPYKMYT